MAIRATGERPVVVGDEGGSNKKAKEEGGADLFLNLFVGEKKLTMFFGLNQMQGAQGKDRG